MMPWMEAHKTLKIITGLPETQNDGLWKLFEHKLGFHQFWSFTNDKMVVTVFKDNEVVRTGSTAFKLVGMDSSIIVPDLATTINLLNHF